MSKPFFSIILPTHNRGHLLSTAIESVQNQIFTKWELIVIDDGSTDETKSVVLKYQLEDKRISYHYQENAERSAARNRGITLSNGKYICFIDSDDYYLPEYLLRFEKFIQKNKQPEALIFCNLSFEVNKKIIPFQLPDFQDYTPAEFFILNGIGTPRVCLHQNIVEHHRFDPTMSISEDTDLWIRITRDFPFMYLEDFLYVAVQHDQRSVSRLNTNSARKNLRAKKKILSGLSSQEVSPKIRRDVLHNAWFGLAQSYFENKHFFGLLGAALNASLYKPLRRWKEKLYMLFVVFKSKIL